MLEVKVGGGAAGVIVVDNRGVPMTVCVTFGLVNDVVGVLILKSGEAAARERAGGRLEELVDLCACLNVTGPVIVVVTSV